MRNQSFIIKENKRFTCNIVWQNSSNVSRRLDRLRVKNIQAFQNKKKIYFELLRYKTIVFCC